MGFWGLSLGAAVGLPLLVTEDRIRAAIPGLVAGDHLAAAARQVRVPVSFLMQWDDELVPRAAALALLTRSAHQSRPFALIPAATPRFRAMNTRTPQPSSAATSTSSPDCLTSHRRRVGTGRGNRAPPARAARPPWPQASGHPDQGLSNGTMVGSFVARCATVANMLVELWWDVEDAEHIRSRSTRYPDTIDIEPEWTLQAASDPTRVVRDPDPRSRAAYAGSSATHPAPASSSP